MYKNEERWHPIPFSGFESAEEELWNQKIYERPSVKRERNLIDLYMIPVFDYSAEKGFLFLSVRWEARYPTEAPVF